MRSFVSVPIRLNVTLKPRHIRAGVSTHLHVQHTLRVLTWVRDRVGQSESTTTCLGSNRRMLRVRPITVLPSSLPFDYLTSALLDTPVSFGTRTWRNGGLQRGHL